MDQIVEAANAVAAKEVENAVAEANVVAAKGDLDDLTINLANNSLSDEKVNENDTSSEEDIDLDDI